MKSLKLFSLGVLCMLIASMMFNACSDEEEKIDLNQEESVPNELLQDAKSWFKQQTDEPGLFNIRRADENILKPLWSQAKLVKLSGGQQAIIAPAQKFIPDNKTFHLERGFIFPVNNGKINDGKLVEFYSKDPKLADAKYLLENFVKGNMKGFTGAIVN